jgi:S-adenosylmethionine hydrolase
MKKIITLFVLISTALLGESALVIQTDFGTKDGAVAAMKGVAVGVDPRLAIYDLSHENTPFDVWEAAYRLKQTAPFWPTGTVFVSVIDPGVGTERKSVVLRTKTGQLFVGPDNGTWTLIAEELGISEVREIDESKHRRAGSEKSHTFHGRDVYVYVGAQLAAGVLAFSDVGPMRPPRVVMLPYERARRDGDELVGTIPYLDFQFGNVWTNLDEALFRQLDPQLGENFRVTIRHAGEVKFEGIMPYHRTFGDVPNGAPLLYVNSLMNIAFALNQGSFVQAHGIESGAEWSVHVRKIKP